MELLLSFNNNNSPSLTITALLLSDGKSYEFTIFLKPQHLYNYSLSKHVLPLPTNEEKQDSYKKGEFDLTQNLISKLHKLMICQFKDFNARSWDLRKRFVVVPILREFVEQEKFIPIGKSTIDEDKIQDQDNDTDEGENILENSRVMKLMTNMGYEKGKGLGRQSEGPPAFVLDYEIRQQNHTYGIGYRSTAWDDFKQKQLRIAKAQAKREYVPFEVPMRPYPLSLNGQFTRAGDIFPFWGFQEPVIAATGWDV